MLTSQKQDSAMSQILADIPASSGAEQVDVKCPQPSLGCFWSPLLYRSSGTKNCCFPSVLLMAFFKIIMDS